MKLIPLLLTATALFAADAAAQITLTELARVDLGSTANPANPEHIGNLPSAVAWDGTDLYVAGYNNGGAPTGTLDCGIVRVSNAATAPTLGPAFGVVLATPVFRGYSGLDVLTTTSGTTVVAAYDDGTATPRGIAAYDAAGTLIWSKNARGGSGVAVDPGVPPTPATPIGVAWTTFGKTRLSLQDFATGLDIFTDSNGAVIGPTGINSGDLFWRGMDFDDSTGDWYGRYSNQLVRVQRTGANTTTSAEVFDLGLTQGNFIGFQFVGVMNTPSGTVVLFNDRPTNNTNRNFFDPLTGESAVVKAVRPDGTPDVLDFGSFTPFDPTNNGNAGNFDFSYDAASNTLAMLDSTARYVYLFSVSVPPYYTYGTGCTSSAGSEARLAFNGPGVPGQTLSVDLSGGPGQSLAAVLFGIGQLEPGLLPINSQCSLQVQFYIGGWEITPISLDAMGNGGVSFGVGPLTPGFSFECQGVMIDTGLVEPIQIATTNGISYRLP